MTPTYQLDEHHIDVWHIPLSPNDDFLSQLHLLNKEEQKRYERFYFPIHRRRFAQARIALKELLSKYLACDPQNIHLLYHNHGKPYLIHPTHIQFNLSHSQDRALLVIGKKHALGIDIEHFSTRPFLGIAANLFSHNEQAFLHKTPPSLLALKFFTIWSRKEALIKANGFGLAYPTDKIDLHLLPDISHQSMLIEDPFLKESWSIQTHFPIPAFAASLCYHPSIQTRFDFNYHIEKGTWPCHSAHK